MTAPDADRVRELVSELRDDGPMTAYAVASLGPRRWETLLTAAEAWADAQEDRDDDEKLRARMTSLLNGVANAIHGEPDPDTMHSWHDLPELAKTTQARIAELEAERDRLKAALQSIENCRHAVEVGRSPFRQACDIARAALERADG